LPHMMGGRQLSNEQKRLLASVWDEISKRMQVNFMIVLDYHVYKVKGEHARKLFIEDPLKFRDAFTTIFGHGVWKLFEKIISDACKKLGIDPDIFLRIFEYEDPLF